MPISGLSYIPYWSKTGCEMLNIFNRKKPGQEQEDQIDILKLDDIVRYFPIGHKVRYTPDYVEDIILESIIIGYGINEYVLYSENDLEIHTDLSKPVIIIDDNGNKITISKVSQFYFLIPNDEDNMANLDYIRRSQIGIRGQFAPGNNISLMSHSYNQQGIPYLDTTVRKRVRIKGGYYANHDMVMLDILENTFSIKDQRSHYRISTRIPVLLHLSDQDDDLSCTIVDFSETSMQIRFENTESIPGKLEEGKEVILTVGKGQQFKTFVLKCEILRSGEDYAVIIISEVLKDNHFVRPAVIDLLDIKSNLLKYPETRQALTTKD
jgi:hypothetical protein